LRQGVAVSTPACHVAIIEAQRQATLKEGKSLFWSGFAENPPFGGPTSQPEAGIFGNNV
jgi:hypothetical protein